MLSLQELFVQFPEVRDRKSVLFGPGQGRLHNRPDELVWWAVPMYLDVVRNHLRGDKQ